MKVTIKEIAERAGVHRATVDKVLHDRKGVSTEVRERIRQIIEEVGYTPNPAGRVLQKQGKTYHIAAILIDVDALPYLKEGIELGVHWQVGFDIEIHYHINAFQDAQGQMEHIDRAAQEQVDAIILSPINDNRVRGAIDRAVEAGVPIVTTNADIDGTKRNCYVGMDSGRASRVAGRLMGQLLGGQGKVAIISSAIETENNSYFMLAREQGFSTFIKTTYPGVHIAAVIESFEDPRITYEKTVRLFETHPDLQGIYITCGGVAEVGRAIIECGRRDTIKVISYEDYPQILNLIREEVIDCTLASELQRQGALPVQIIMDHLVFGRKAEQEQFFTEIKILVKESLF